MYVHHIVKEVRSMNPMNDISAKAYVVKVSGKPNPPKNQAIVGKLPVKMLQNIDPARTPPEAYTKKQP